jgi:hypothetical protein
MEGGLLIQTKVFRGTIMRRKMSGLITLRRISQIVMVILTLFLAGNFTDANA